MSMCSECSRLRAHRREANTEKSYKAASKRFLKHRREVHGAYEIKLGRKNPLVKASSCLHEDLKTLCAPRARGSECRARCLSCGSTLYGFRHGPGEISWVTYREQPKKGSHSSWKFVRQGKSSLNVSGEGKGSNKVKSIQLYFTSKEIRALDAMTDWVHGGSDEDLIRDLEKHHLYKDYRRGIEKISEARKSLKK